MAIRVGINGFGSIGRRFLRIALTRPEIQVVAVNDLTPPETAAHLLKYDSNYGTLAVDVKAVPGGLLVGDALVRFTSERDPANIPWAESEVEIVLEATGKFTDGDTARAHLRDGGPHTVIITAPAKHEDLTVVVGVNHTAYDPDQHRVLSNASCTTNCLAPVAKVLHEQFGIVAGMMNTIHAYTNDQVTLDFPHNDLRRARAAGQNIIPTSTGAAKAIGKVMPELAGRLNGLAIRVPVPVVSIVDLTVTVSHDTTAEDVNFALQRAAQGELAGILGYSDEPLVSGDYKGSTDSATVDGLSTIVTGGNLVKVIAWYDNEWGYSCRLADLVEYVALRQRSRAAMVEG